MKTHKEIIDFIRVVRQGYPDSGIVYTHGACYGFYQILKHLNKKAVAYMTDDHQHIVTKLGDRYYDIDGEFINGDGELARPVIKLTPRLHDNWECCSSGQRLEHMLSKYNENLK